MTDRACNIVNKVVVSVVSGIMILIVAGLYRVSTDSQIQAATVAQHEKRIDASELDRRQIRDLIGKISEQLAATSVKLDSIENKIDAHAASDKKEK